ncbi:MAG: hypothetical protein ACI3XI_00895 [Eubacteriales bacterium]
MKEIRHPRLAFWLTLIPAALAAALAVYHLAVTALTVADPRFLPMLGGFTGSIYLIFDFFMMSLPTALLLLAALLMNLFWSRRLSKAWNLSAIAAIGVVLLAGLALILGLYSTALSVVLNLAARATAQSLTAVTLVFSLAKKK